MTEIPKHELHNFFNQEITMIENGRENTIIFNREDGAWLSGVSLTNHSAIQILKNSKQDEHSAKYFLK